MRKPQDVRRVGEGPDEHQRVAAHPADRRRAERDARHEIQADHDQHRADHSARRGLFAIDEGGGDRRDHHIHPRDKGGTRGRRAAERGWQKAHRLQDVARRQDQAGDPAKDQVAAMQVFEELWAHDHEEERGQREAQRQEQVGRIDGQYPLDDEEGAAPDECHEQHGQRRRQPMVRECGATRQGGPLCHPAR